jgi:hypothetical protein
VRVENLGVVVPLVVVTVGFATWATWDVTKRSDAAFGAAGHTKKRWLLLMASGVVTAGALSVLGLFYLASVRPAVRVEERRALGHS